MNNLAESHVLSRLGLPGRAEPFDMQSIWKMNKPGHFTPSSESICKMCNDRQIKDIFLSSNIHAGMTIAQTDNNSVQLEGTESQKCKVGLLPSGFVSWTITVMMN